MAETNEHIIEKIIKYVRLKGGDFSFWYVGVAKKPENALFKVHGVPKKGSPWFYDIAFNHEDANKIEEHLIRLGFDGAAFERDPKADGVYVYKKTGHTKD